MYTTTKKAAALPRTIGRIPLPAQAPQPRPMHSSRPSSAMASAGNDIFDVPHALPRRPSTPTPMPTPAQSQPVSTLAGAGRRPTPPQALVFDGPAYQKPVVRSFSPDPERHPAPGGAVASLFDGPAYSGMHSYERKPFR
ncbi:hypothetical protein HMN09_00855100 [Mycena chlorophos]|uniref:Uncharacterized protein n=1 Tax=Mycena chlorophos TaxID=658473 RepID=A0A8H6SV69_MYCCL|nr:hypothetical protein HMN09_00855100 [Mycena chlorophos]